MVHVITLGCVVLFILKLLWCIISVIVIYTGTYFRFTSCTLINFHTLAYGGGPCTWPLKHSEKLSNYGFHGKKWMQNV